MNIGAVVFLIAVAWAIYRLQYFGSIDPNNLGATPSRFSIAVRAAITMVAVVAVVSLQSTHSDWMPFLCMFALAQTVATPFKAPDRMSEKEQLSALQRGVIQFKSGIAGGVVANVLALGFAWIAGALWIYLLGAVGVALSIGKLLTAQVGSADHESEVVTQKELVSDGVWGILAYCAVVAVFASDWIQIGELTAWNWSGWAGLGAGVLASSIAAALVE